MPRRMTRRQRESYTTVRLVYTTCMVKFLMTRQEDARRGWRAGGLRKNKNKIVRVNNRAQSRGGVDRVGDRIDLSAGG